MASIKGNKERQQHAEEEIKKQAKKIKENVVALQYPMSTNFIMILIHIHLNGMEEL